MDSCHQQEWGPPLTWRLLGYLGRRKCLYFLNIQQGHRLPFVPHRDPCPSWPLPLQGLPSGVEGGLAWRQWFWSPKPSTAGGREGGRKGQAGRQGCCLLVQISLSDIPDLWNHPRLPSELGSPELPGAHQVPLCLIWPAAAEPTEQEGSLGGSAFLWGNSGFVRLPAMASQCHCFGQAFQPRLRQVCVHSYTCYHCPTWSWWAQLVSVCTGH